LDGIEQLQRISEGTGAMNANHGNRSANSALAQTTALRPKHGTVLWLMGPTSAGKSTLAGRAVAELRLLGVPIIGYDGDEIRDMFGSDLAFAPGDRLRVVAALACLANKAAHAGLHVIVSALTAGQDARDYIRGHIDELMIGYVACSIETCARRDPKGLYERAKRGEIDTLVGYNSEYRPPADPDLVLDTERHAIEELVRRIVGHIADAHRRIV
jgi:adenylylsulfate kinase-like enzyme